MNKQQNLVNNLNDKINNIDLEIENLTDIAPENTYDLRPGGKGFDPQNWVSRLQELKLNKYTTTLELETTLNTYFDNIKEEGHHDGHVQSNYSGNSI